MTTTHGMTHHPLFTVYACMKARCYNPKNSSYKNYGAKGVRICEEWLKDKTLFFEWALNNGWAKGLQLDKDIIAKRLGIPADLYSPDRCSFVTHQQNLECKSTAKYLTFRGETKTVTEWAKITGIPRTNIYDRLNISKWTVEEAITIPNYGRKESYGYNTHTFFRNKKLQSAITKAEAFLNMGTKS